MNLNHQFIYDFLTSIVSSIPINTVINELWNTYTGMPLAAVILTTMTSRGLDFLTSSRTLASRPQYHYLQEIEQ